MSKLIDLQSQIDKLQKQAQEIRSKEFSSTVAEILRLMAAYGITVKDLQAPKAKSKLGRTSKPVEAKAPKTRKDKASVAAKYKGPNGDTWSGRGLMPKWLSALVAAGQSKDSFLIKSESMTPTVSENAQVS